MAASRYLLECIHLSREVPGREVPGRELAGHGGNRESGRLLVDDINFQLARSEVLAVVGPSGAGKSSLLRLLNRLDEPTGGQVLIDGRDFRELTPRQLRLRVGMVMQQAFLFPGTVAENIAFGPAQAGRKLTPAAIGGLLSQVGLEGYASRNVANLSGGEAQRVAILRALANDPELLLLDEPTSALDEAAKLAVESVLASLIERRQLTCIWVTHDDRQAKRLAGKVLVLEGGRVRALHAVERWQQ
jgi:putative ABC transport system ATP-binding protein